MKLYTEEQVIEHMYWCSPVYMDREDIKIFLKNKSTPIELPSDEEIEEYASKYAADGAIILGAKWMKEQILNQNHGQAGRTFTQDLIPKN